MKYTVSMATWYKGQWHLDLNTESSLMGEAAVIAEGRKLTAMGAMPLYTEYVNGIAGRVMVEYDGHLEPAFAEMVAPRPMATVKQMAA